MSFYFHGGLRLFLGLIGLAFVLKAVIDMGDDLHFAVASAKETKAEAASGTPKAAAPSASRGTEDMLLLWFGFTALLLVAAGPSAGLAASPALGLAALGKALPSLASSTKSSSGSAGGGGATKLDLTFNGTIVGADGSESAASLPGTPPKP